MYQNVTQIQRDNRAIGHHFFDPATMRFWRSRVHGNVYGGRFFVTSERPPYGPRAYTVRAARPDGGVDTVGDYGGYPTGDAAHRAARRLARV
jgi:hypothetical protein